MKYLFTSESVSEGHPDKMADQISDAILDALLATDPKSRVACETLIKTGMVIVAGEITTNAHLEVEAVVRETVKKIGYNSSDMGFDWESCAVMSAIGKQSADIAMGVDEKIDPQSESGEKCGQRKLGPNARCEMNEPCRAEKPADTKSETRRESLGRKRPVRRPCHPGIGLDLHELIEHRGPEGGE